MSDLSEVKAQRLMILGAISEMSAEERAQIEAARSALVAAIELFAEVGQIALTLVTMDIAIKQAETT